MGHSEMSTGADRAPEVASAAAKKKQPRKNTETGWIAPRTYAVLIHKKSIAAIVQRLTNNNFSVPNSLERSHLRARNDQSLSVSSVAAF
jgi:hypothetical protein